MAKENRHRCTVKRVEVPWGYRWESLCESACARYVVDSWPEAVVNGLGHFYSMQQTCVETVGWGDALVFHAAFARPRPRAA